MSSFLKKLLLASAIFGMGLSAVACGGDDDPNETDMPQIFEEVSNIWEKANCSNSEGMISCSTQCAAIHKVILEIKDKNVVPLKDACAEYNKSLEAMKGKPEKLAGDMDNSGFYLSSYILLNNMQKAFYGCAIDSVGQDQIKTDWEKLFNDRGCTTLLSDAEKVVKARGKS